MSPLLRDTCTCELQSPQLRGPGQDRERLSQGPSVLEAAMLAGNPRPGQGCPQRHPGCAGGCKGEQRGRVLDRAQGLSQPGQTKGKLTRFPLQPLEDGDCGPESPAPVPLQETGCPVAPGVPTPQRRPWSGGGTAGAPLPRTGPAARVGGPGRPGRRPEPHLRASVRRPACSRPAPG